MPRRSIVELIFLAGLAWLALVAYARFDGIYHPWPVELIDTFALYAFAPFLVVGLAALVARSRLLLGLFALAGVLFWQQLGHVFLPSPASAAPPGTTLRVLTQNVLYTSEDASELAGLIRAEQPDVVVLQEMSDAFAQDLTERLGRDYPFRTQTTTRSHRNGRGTFSRLPIRETDQFQLSPRSATLQRVLLTVGEREVWLYNVHLTTPRLWTRNPPGPIPPLMTGFRTDVREAELHQLLGDIRLLDKPYVLAGDFNLVAGSRPYRQLPDEWHDAFAERGSGFGHTFPTHYVWRGLITLTVPVIRIDYVLSSPEIIPVSARVPTIQSSDHLPVLADLVVPGS
jgi:endonuclease/exonuclease/phosphatase (EEP) superfamily protein YafD